VKKERVEMRRQVQKSRVLGRNSKEAEDLPPFISNQSQVSRFHDSVDSDSTLDEKQDRQISKQQAPQRRPKTYPRARIIFAKIFQNLAYMCIALGIGAVLCVVVAIVINHIPQQEVNNVVINDGGGSGGWVMLMLGGLVPRIMNFLQIIIGVIGILMMIWMWRTAVRATRKLIWRVSDEMMKPLSMVEPISLLALWTIGIVGAWWMAEAEFFLPLVVACLIFLSLGMISLGLMRKLSGRKLDFVRADLVKR